jgi:hypothetical protein
MVLALAFAASGGTARADPAAWSIAPPAHADLAATDSLLVGIPSSLNATQLASLALEIDQVDVTALSRIGDGKILCPPQALGPGKHELQVVEYSSDGRLIPRGRWQFSVTAGGAARPARGWSVKGNAGGTVSERVQDSNLTPPAPPSTTANGTFDVAAKRTVNEWTAEGTVKGLYGSDNGTSAIGGSGVQPAQIQAALKYGKDSVIVGDQTLSFDNLVISGLARRGVSGHLGDLPFGTDATAFSVRDSALAGFYGGLGVGDANDLVSGAVVQTHPVPGAPKALTVQAAVVTGTAPAGLSTIVPYPGGNGAFPPSAPVGAVMPVQSGSGSAWVLGVNSEVPGSSLKMNGQFASSSFEFPGISGQAATRSTDNAYSAAVGYTQPLPDQWALTANAIYQNVGTYFTSLANPSLPPDRRTATLTASASGHGLTVAASGGLTEDNTDDNAALATVRTLPRNLTINYGPRLPADIIVWLGTPTASVAWQDARSYDDTLPPGSQATLSKIENGTASVSFAYPHFSWTAGFTDGTFRDGTGLEDNTDTAGPTVGMNVVLGKAFVSFNLQLLDSHDLKTDTHTLDHNYGINAGDTFLSGRLTAQLNVAINRNTQQIIPGLIPPQLVGNDVQLKTASAQLTWHAIAPTRRLGGLDVGLASSWNESTGLNSSVLTAQGFSALATRGQQTFLTVSSKWPLNFGDP